jgi:putative tryptophan/tyrosine transport system substrate-binding protein
VTLLGLELGSKRLELLREVVPTAGRIAVLVNPNNPVTAQSNVQEVQIAALGLKLEIIIVNGGTENEIDKAFASAIQQGATALFVGADGFLASRYNQIAALALRNALPTSAANREAVAVGMLMSYGSSQIDAYRQAGIYVGRILKGEKPADLPVQQPTKFELVINLTTAKALGLDIPLHLQQRADEVIE